MREDLLIGTALKQYYQGRCNCHIANLIAGDAMSVLGMNEKNKKVRDIVETLHNHPKQKEAYDDVLRNNMSIIEQSIVKLPPKDVKTRFKLQYVNYLYILLILLL